MKAALIILFSLSILHVSSQCFQKIYLNEGISQRDVVSITLQQIPVGTYVGSGIYFMKTECILPVLSDQKEDVQVKSHSNSQSEYLYEIPPQKSSSLFTFCINGGQRSSDPCSAIDTLFENMMNTADTTLDSPEQMGALASDSIHVYTARMRYLHAQGRLVLTLPQVDYLTDTTSYIYWLTHLFDGVVTTPDSIERLCKWVPAHYAYDEFDQRSDTLSPDSMHKMILRYELRGLCRDYAMFVAKIASQHFPSWGYPIILKGRTDTSIAGAGQQPAHIFLGFAKKNGKIWIIADPTIGGIVRDKQTGNVISYDVFRSWIHQVANSKRLNVRPVLTAVQMTGQCAFRVSFRDTVGLEFFSTGVLALDGLPADITRGHWFTYGEPGSGQYSFYANYWKAAGYPRNCIYNIYDHVQYGGGVLFGTPVVAAKIANRYGFPIGLH